ncbi:hypothetical protein LTS08_006533 [Lithohypha guttulata]|nr:hypothetical protein LTS08_006533 [Lithohypha guttulata]
MYQTSVSTRNPLATPSLLTVRMSLQARDFVKESSAHFLDGELNPFAQEFMPLKEESGETASTKRLDPEAILFCPGQGSHYTKLQTVEELRADVAHRKQEQSLALVQCVDPLSTALASLEVQPCTSITIVAPLVAVRAHIQSLWRQASVPDHELRLRQVLPARHLLWTLMCTFRKQIRVTINKLCSEISSQEHCSSSREQACIVEDYEMKDRNATIPIMYDRPVRPARQCSDDRERDTFFPEDDNDQNKHIDTSTKLSALLGELRSLGPHGKSHMVLRKTGFGPSKQQLELEWKVTQQKMNESPQQLSTPYHHLSFLGYGAPCKSATDPALSLAIINTMPKASLSFRDDIESLHVPAILQQAFLFVDPVVLFGDHAAIKGLSANQIREVTVGQVSKFYQGYGIWSDDTYDPDEDSPLEDQADPDYYPRCCTVYNGIMTGSGQPDQTAFNTAIEVAYNDDLAEWKAIRAGRSKLFLPQSRAQTDTMPPKSSPLRQVYTPETMVVADIEHEKAQALRNDALLRPASKSWADLDDEQDENDTEEKLSEVATKETDDSLTSELTQATSCTTPFCGICLSDSPSKGPCKPAEDLQDQYFIVPAYLHGMLAHLTCVQRLTIKKLRDERLSGYQGLHAAIKQRLTPEHSSLSTTTSTGDAQIPDPFEVSNSDNISAEVGEPRSPPEVHDRDEQARSDDENTIDTDSVFSAADKLEPLNHDTVNLVEQGISDEDLFEDMTLAEEYERINRVPVPEVSSSDASSEEFSENKSPGHLRGEEFSPVPSPEIQRIVSDYIIPSITDTAQNGEAPVTPTKNATSRPETIVHTPESIKGTVQKRRRLSNSVLNDASNIIVSPRYIPKANIPRSEASWDLRDVLKVVKEDKAEVQQSVAALSAVLEEDEAILDAVPELLEQPRSLAQMNADYRAFHGLPEVGQQSLREEYADEIVSAPVRTPTAVRAYRQRKSQLHTLSPIMASSPTIVEEEEEEEIEPPTASSPLVLVDTDSETGEAVIYPSHLRSSLSEEDLAPATPTRPARPISVTPNRGLFGCSSSPNASSSMTDSTDSIDSSRLTSVFSGFDGDNTRQPYKISYSTGVSIEAIVMHPITHVDDIPATALLPWQTDLIDPELNALPPLSTLQDASSRRECLGASPKPQRSWRRRASTKLATLLRGTGQSEVGMFTKDTTSTVASSTTNAPGIIGNAKDQVKEKKGLLGSIRNRIVSTLRRRS